MKLINSIKQTFLSFAHNQKLNQNKENTKMQNKLFIGNLAFSISEQELRNMFESIGPITSANLVTDRNTGRTRGFGFVEMQNEGLAQDAIRELNGKEFDGREIGVSVAKPQERRTENNRGNRHFSNNRRH